MNYPKETWVGGKQQRLLILLAEHFYLLVCKRTKGRFFKTPKITNTTFIVLVRTFLTDDTRI